MSKEQFLIDHNKLSPINLKATFALLTKFQQEKRPLLKDAEWSNKLRMPFISWLISLQQVLPEENKNDKIPPEQVYRNYPETHY